MNFNQLEYIIAVDEHKKFHEAAFSCQVTQATLSAMIIKLENEVGFQIFDRSTKPISTTELGVQLVATAREIIQLRNAVFDIGKEVPQTISGELKIGVIPTVANSLLSRVLPDLLSMNPRLQLKVKEITTEEIIGQLKRGSIDFGIAATPLNENSLEEHIMYYEPMLVYGCGSNDKEYVLSEELMDEKVWLLEEGHCFREQVMTVCGLHEKQSAVENLSFEGNSFETLLSMVDAFGGQTLVPELYYLDMGKDLQNQTKPFQRPIPVREISIVSYAPSQKSLSTQFLAEFIQDRIEPLLSTREHQNKDLRVVGIN